MKAKNDSQTYGTGLTQVRWNKPDEKMFPGDPGIVTLTTCGHLLLHLSYHTPCAATLHLGRVSRVAFEPAAIFFHPQNLCWKAW